MRPGRASILPTIWLLLAALAGCGGSSGGAPSSSKPSPTAAASPSAAAGPVLQTITIDESEFKLVPAAVSLMHPGTYDFKAVDVGTTQHALEIKGNGIDSSTDRLSPGQSADLKVNLTAGTYTMLCPVDGHQALGMTGQITVAG